MIRKIKTKFLIVLLGVYLAGALSIFPVTGNLTQNNSLDFSVKQASAQSITCPNLIDYSSVNLTTKVSPAFIKITKDGKTLDGQQVRINATVTLNSHDKIGFDTGYRWPPASTTSVWVGSPYCIDSPGYNDWIEELRLIAINEKNAEAACRVSAFSQCTAQYESPSDYFEERYMNRGEPVPWSLELTPSDLAGMNLLSSPEGTINRIKIIPRFYTSPTLSQVYVADADFPDAGAFLTLQVFDDEKQLENSGSTVPPGVETETEATGGNSDSNKLKTCFTQAKDAVFCVLNLFLGAIGSFLEQFIKIIWANIIAEGLRITLAIRTYSDDFANVIYPAWIILRNLTNIAFILAIIAMGVATVFRISGWMVRDLMIKLIIGAFLVNFSLVIPQAILGIAETVQNQFLSADSGAINAISNQLLSFHLFDNSTKNFGSFSETIRIFMNLWVVLFAFIAFCGILFIVVVRLIVIWILLMTSPLIYAAYIFPATRSFFNKWWSTFMKWAFISAAVGFMLNLTAIVTFQSRDLLIGLSGVDPASIGGEAPILYEFMTQLIPIIFLYATVKVATSMGSGINSFVDKTLAKGTAFATGAGAGALLALAAKPVVSGAKLGAKGTQFWARSKQVDLADKIRQADQTGTKASWRTRAGMFALGTLTGGPGIIGAKKKRLQAKYKDREAELEDFYADQESRKYDILGQHGMKDRALNKLALRTRFSAGEREFYNKYNTDDFKRTDSEYSEQRQEMAKSLKTDFKNRLDAVLKAEVDEIPQKANEVIKDLNSEIELQKNAGNAETVEKLENDKKVISQIIDSAYKQMDIEAVAGKQGGVDNLVKRKEAYDSLVEISNPAKSYLQTSVRHKKVQEAINRMPDEDYDQDIWMRRFRELEARGDVYGMLRAYQDIEKEGDVKVLLEAHGKDQTADGLREFIKDKFKGLGDEEVIRIMAESDKRLKSSETDLAYKVSYNVATGQREVEENAVKRLNKQIGKFAPGNLSHAVSQISGRDVVVSMADGTQKMNELYLEVLGKLGTDFQSLDDLYRYLSNSAASRIVSAGKLGEIAEKLKASGKLPEEVSEVLTAIKARAGDKGAMQHMEDLRRQYTRDIYGTGATQTKLSDKSEDDILDT